MLFAGGLLWAGLAQAETDRVLLLEPAGQANPGFSGALSVQLTGAAELSGLPLPDAPSLPARVQAARELGQRQAALLVVWVEGPVRLADGSDEAVLYAVGQREGRALLEVVRVPGGAGPDLDRTLALKVRELVDELHRDRARAPSESMLEPAPPAPSARPTSGPRVGAEIALAALAHPAAGGSPARIGTGVAAGPSLGFPGARLGVRLELGWFPAVEAARAGALVRFDELAPALTLGAALREGPLWLGAHSGAGLARIVATGASASGAAAREAHEDVAQWLAGADLELPVGAGFGLALGIELQLRLRRQHFAVDGREIVDLGRVAALASFGVSWRVPSAEP